MEQYNHLLIKVSSMPNHKLVYSTDDSINLKEKDPMPESMHLENKIRLHLERKKGGKILTIIKGNGGKRQKLKQHIKNQHKSPKPAKNRQNQAR